MVLPRKAVKRVKVKRLAGPKGVLKIKEVLNQGKAHSKLKANPRNNLKVKANLRASPHKEAALRPLLLRY